ncbi:MAG: RNA methyltransferase [Bacteroidales bacterium]|nr:RNA methyltransferase [Bacteroidales bacterium]
MEEIITSVQNPKVKQLLALQQKSSLRRESGLFVVEGVRELEHCVNAGYEVDTIFCCKEILPSGRDASGLCGGKVRTVFLSRQVYEKVAYREGTEGVIAEVRSRSISLEDLRLPENPLIVVLESVEKPGNLGAVLRSADAAGAHAVLVCDALTDIYNPNLIRASLGAVFSVPVVCCSSAKAIDFLKERGVKILTAQLQDSELYYDIPMKEGTALVMGTESTGLTQIWRQAADAHIRIPMLGKLDSLNVSVSTAILLFEAVRQRNA